MGESRLGGIYANFIAVANVDGDFSNRFFLCVDSLVLYSRNICQIHCHSMFARHCLHMLPLTQYRHLLIAQIHK